MKYRIATVLAGMLTVAALMPLSGFDGNEDQSKRHVLLISIDGMHSVDFYNCAHGISGINGGASYCPNLAALAA